MDFHYIKHLTAITRERCDEIVDTRKEISTFMVMKGDRFLCDVPKETEVGEG
jgi:hypothetical protein